MSWKKESANGVLVASETNTLPSSATTEYSSEISFLKGNPAVSTRAVSVWIKASAVSGTNLDIALYGADKAGGTKFLLAAAIVNAITDLTCATAAVDLLDLNRYPAPFYYIAWTSDADESANTIEVKIMTTDPAEGTFTVDGIGADPS